MTVHSAVSPSGTGYCNFEVTPGALGKYTSIKEIRYNMLGANARSIRVGWSRESHSTYTNTGIHSSNVHNGVAFLPLATHS